MTWLYTPLQTYAINHNELNVSIAHFNILDCYYIMQVINREGNFNYNRTSKSFLKKICRVNVSGVKRYCVQLH